MASRSRALPLATKAGGFDVPRSLHACCKGHVVWRKCVARGQTASKAANTGSALMADYCLYIWCDCLCLWHDSLCRSHIAWQARLREPNGSPREPKGTPREPNVSPMRVESKLGGPRDATFFPTEEGNEVIERGVIKAIQQRILHWKSVGRAWKLALRTLSSVFTNARPRDREFKAGLHALQSRPKAA